MHVGHMESHVSSCMALLKPINRGVPIQFMGAKIQFVGGAARRRRRKGKEKGRRGKEKGRKGKEKWRKRKEKKRKEEKRKRKGRKRGKRKRKMKECCAVSRPRWKRTRKCATRGRFPSTLVILRLGAV